MSGSQIPVDLSHIGITCTGFNQYVWLEPIRNSNLAMYCYFALSLRFSVFYEALDYRTLCGESIDDSGNCIVDICARLPGNDYH